MNKFFSRLFNFNPWKYEALIILVYNVRFCLGILFANLFFKIVFLSIIIIIIQLAIICVIVFPQDCRFNDRYAKQFEKKIRADKYNNKQHSAAITDRWFLPIGFSFRYMGCYGVVLGWGVLMRRAMRFLEKIAMGRVGIKLRGLLPQTARRTSQKENNNYRTIDSF